MGSTRIRSMQLNAPWSYLFRRTVPALAIPPTAVYALYRILVRLGRSDHIPAWSRGFFGLAFGSITFVVTRNFVMRLWRSIIVRREMKKLGAVPIPKLKGGKLPGNLDLVMWMTRTFPKEYPGGVFVKLKQDNGDLFNLNILGRSTIWSDCPYYIKEVLTSQFPNFIKGTSLKGSFDSFLGVGIFNSDGETWRFHRNMTRPFFSRDRVTDFEIFDRHTETVVKKIRDRCETGSCVDFQEAIMQFTMDSASEFLFGQSVNALDAPLSLPGGKPFPRAKSTADASEFSTAFTKVLEYIATRNRGVVPWQLRELLGDPSLKDAQVMYDLVDPIIDRALDKAKGLEGPGDDAREEKETLLSSMVLETSDRAIIRDEILNILLAGRDTTAANLTFTIYALALYPHVLARLRQEVLNVVGPSQRPTFDHIREMKYLRAVINESLRLFPPVPFDVKEAVNSTVLTNPLTGVRYYMPGKCFFAWSMLSMHRRTDLWGPDALDFDPDRWLDERNKKYYLQNPFIFLPFIAGPRICLGQQFAYNEVSFFLIRFLQRFEQVELAPDGHPEGTLPPPEWADGVGTRKPMEKIRPMVHLTMYVKGGLWLRVK